MPRLQFYAIPLPFVQSVSRGLVDELAVLMNVAREHFVLESVTTQFVFDGAPKEGSPYVEVHCFDRGTEVFDRAAEAITRHLKLAGLSEVDVTFRLLQRRHYYENGQSLGR